MTGEQIRAFSNRKIAKAVVKDLGEVSVIRLSGAQKIELQGECSQIKDKAAAYLAWELGVIKAGLVDESGKPVFADQQQVETFSHAVDHETLDAIYDAIAKHNGLVRGSVEDAEKN